MDDAWMWVYLGVQTLQTIQVIALKKQVKNSMLPPRMPERPPLPPQPTGMSHWRSWLPEERETPDHRKRRS
jgi:hypothetical protein